MIDEPGGPIDSEASYIALRELSVASPVPQGSCKIHAVMRAASIETSEATVGRLLRDLDLAGYTRPIGNKGRVLTEEGQRHLQALEQHRAHRLQQEDILRVIRSERIEDLLDILNARRIVETETARLAAFHVTESELAQLEQAVRWHKEYMLGVGGKPDQNIIIHRLVAEASRSRILQALVNLLYNDQRLIQTHYRIQLVMRGRFPEEHDPLLAALVQRDPQKAAEAMGAHISYLIQVVQQYAKQPEALPR